MRKFISEYRKEEFQGPETEVIYNLFCFAKYLKIGVVLLLFAILWKDKTCLFFFSFMNDPSWRLKLCE